MNGSNQKAKENIKKQYRINKKNMIELFGGKCSRCGFRDDIWALEFHHVNKNEKNHTPSNLMFLKDNNRLTSELDKCVMLCSNCHKSFEKSWSAIFVKSNFGYVISEFVTIEVA